MRREVAMMRSAISRLFLACVAIATGCVTGASQPTPDLAGPEWRLVEIDGGPVVASPTPGGRDAYMQLEVDSARVTGFTTCNRFFGSYESAGGGRLRFAQLGSTKMACVDPARSQQEQRFMTVLQAADRYQVAGDTLTLYEGDRPRARFVAAP